MVTIHFPLIIKNRTSFACYSAILTFDLSYTEKESSLLFILEGGLFRLIFRVIFTVFNINIPLFVSGKPCVLFVHISCHRWSNKFMDVELIEENELDGCQRLKLFFVVPGWFLPYFHPPPSFVNNEQYGEYEMSQAFVFVYIFAFNFALTLSPLGFCWARSTTASLVYTLPIYNSPNSLYLVVFSEFLLF